MQPKVELEYIWIDTCYMNKEDVNNHQEDINLTFRYYKFAKVCYVIEPPVLA